VGWRNLPQELPIKAQKKALRDACKAGAKTFAATVKANAPEETGKVKASVKVRAGKRKKNKVAYVVTVTGGHKDSIIGFVEMGRKGQDPNPFIRNAFDSLKGQVGDQVVEDIEAGILKAATES
jgi:HK97 gp10 family phage protein